MLCQKQSRQQFPGIKEAIDNFRVWPRDGGAAPRKMVFGSESFLLLLQMRGWRFRGWVFGQQLWGSVSSALCLVCSDLSLCLLLSLSFWRHCSPGLEGCGVSTLRASLLPSREHSWFLPLAWLCVGKGSCTQEWTLWQWHQDRWMNDCGTPGQNKKMSSCPLGRCELHHGCCIFPSSLWPLWHQTFKHRGLLPEVSIPKKPFPEKELEIQESQEPSFWYLSQ